MLFTIVSQAVQLQSLQWITNFSSRTFGRHRRGRSASLLIGPLFKILRFARIFWPAMEERHLAQRL